MIALDTNILVYAVGNHDSHNRPEQARLLLDRLMPISAIVPLQVVSEFLNVCRKKTIMAMPDALARADEFMSSFICPRTQAPDLLDAGGLSARYNLAYFDAVIVAVASRAGAAILFSEDMHDGLVVDSTKILNPFKSSNKAELDEAFRLAL